jgi:hypothetical protein
VLCAVDGLTAESVARGIAWNRDDCKGCTGHDEQRERDLRQTYAERCREACVGAQIVVCEGVSVQAKDRAVETTDPEDNGTLDQDTAPELEAHVSLSLERRQPATSLIDRGRQRGSKRQGRDE